MNDDDIHMTVANHFQKAIIRRKGKEEKKKEWERKEKREREKRKERERREKERDAVLVVKLNGEKRVKKKAHGDHQHCYFLSLKPFIHRNGHFDISEFWS